jgi:hypothetical protein
VSDDVDDLGMPARPERPVPAERARWTILPSNGEPMLDRKIAIDAKSGDWKKLATLIAMIDHGMRNSLKAPPYIAGFKAQVFIELDSADAATAEGVVRNALYKVGFTELTIQRIHAQNHPSRYGGGAGGNGGGRRIIFPHDDE